jgi:hypothetical protein
VSGSLRRLADQALGRPSAVRPPPRPAWLSVPLPGDRDSGTQDSGEALADAMLASDDVIHADRPTDRPSKAQAEARPLNDVIEAERPVRRATAVGPLAPLHLDELVDPRPSQDDAPSRVQPNSGAQQRAGVRSDGMLQAYRDAKSAPPSQRAAAPAPPDNIRPPQQPRPTVKRSASAPAQERKQASRPEATTRVPTRIAGGNPVSRRSWPESERLSATAAPAPDVHIHIGRVELSAIAAPAPPRREPASAKQPMSLDEYLRRRNGRAP